MSLSPDRRLGNDEVLGLLGAGGTGEIYETRDLRLPQVLHVAADPSYDSIGRDPRFADLLRRLGLPTEGS